MKKLKLCLQPCADIRGQVESVGVTIKLQNVKLQKGEELANIWESVAGVPCAEFSQEPEAVDIKGRLGLETGTEKDPTGFQKKVWKTERETEGEIILNYRFLPRDLSDVTRSHPMFDACNEEGGMLFAGVSCLLEVPEDSYEIQVSWDLSDMPEHTKAVSAKDACYTGHPQDYTFSLYAVGNVKEYTDDNERFAVFWLSEPLPDKERILDAIVSLIKGLCSFFCDEETSYSVFFRKDPFDLSNAGTAFDSCFIYGYSDAMPVSFETSLNTLAHEITHNWPAMESIQGEGDWFVEGTAEYYSMIIPYRCGIIDEEQFAESLNEKSLNYFSNDYIAEPYQNVYQKAWEERDAQRLPYGRGLFYLAETERKLKEKSNGTIGVDDLVLQLVEMKKNGRMPKVSDWEMLIEKELGKEEVFFFRRFQNGEILLQPDERWFDGKFCISRGKYGTQKTKIDENAVLWSVKR